MTVTITVRVTPTPPPASPYFTLNTHTRTSVSGPKASVR